MAITYPSPITGAAQTGLTSPTYTNAADLAPDVNAKQVAVTALGGTQTGVEVHSASQPFLLAFWKPKAFAVLGKANPVTGLIANIANNVYKFITLKGVLPLAGQPYARMSITTSFSVPAGSDIADPESIRAACSAHIGYLWADAAGVGDTVVSGRV